MSLLLEVAIRSERDVIGAQEGGADRLLLSDADGLSPDLTAASVVLREADIPVRVMLRLNDSFTTTGGEFTRLVGLAQEYVALGAQGVAFGFLDADLDVDEDTCTAVAEALPGVPWTFHEAIDACLDTRRTWRALRSLPGLDAVLTSGSPQGLGVGYEDLLATAQADPAAAARMLPGKGLLPEHVPWLARAGVTQFHIGIQTRPGASYKSYVDAGHVRSWRLLLDS
ncbi:copper homeostasis protein CutC [Nocardioides jensenii]|uniref:copper homeostasis protein CutC n=1 Tax=Nocardioides jensenii TaxID=1843 RepID=UPI00082B8150|nr:copper homeostasis protein CutC [Nocardioides jensenii]